MTWLRRHAAWAWSALLVAGLALVLAIRLGGDGTSPSAASMATESQGIVAAEPDGLAAAARRIRTAQHAIEALREQMASAQSDGTVRRQQAAAITEMLTTNTLTSCPPFLQEETTIRALQKIIREASDAAMTAAASQNPLDTAAAVARQRLRRKLEVLRDQMIQEAATFDAQAETLRGQLHLATHELDRLQEDIQRQLQQSHATESPPRAAKTDPT